MADTVQFDLVAPERKLASVTATEVQIPGADGDLTAMAGHAATITSLRPGILKAVTTGGSESFVVTGGFAEIAAETVTVLAEQAIPLAEATAADLDPLIAAAEEYAAGAEDRAAADKHTADLQAVRASLHG